METQTSTTCIFIIIIFLTTCGVSAYEALFVFGDSYTDTGNHNKYDPTLYASWRPPYGITWPGYPSGRYSDGRVFSDYYASYLKLASPIPYRVVNDALSSSTGDGAYVLQSLGGGTGINFAFGGSGVFPTYGPQYPNISAQIDELKELIGKGVVSSKLVNSSIVVLVLAGNDYAAYKLSHPVITEIDIFVRKVVAQIFASLEELYDLGFRTIAVTNLPPVGCLPEVTALSNYTTCNKIDNGELSIDHNTLLSSSISSLQHKYLNAKFILLNLYNAFEAVLTGKTFPLRPCCEGIDGGKCGDRDSNGTLLYNVCSSPQEALFWDFQHPTNAGWKAITKALFPI